MTRLVISDVNDGIGLLGVALGHFENQTGLTEDEIYKRLGDLLQAPEETND